MMDLLGVRTTMYMHGEECDAIGGVDGPSHTTHVVTLQSCFGMGCVNLKGQILNSNTGGPWASLIAGIDSI